MIDDDRTQILTEGTDEYPLDATLAANPEPCPNCQAEILAANQFCNKCGYQRGTWGTEPTSPASPEEPVVALFNLVGETVTVGIPAGESVVGRGDVAIKLNDGYLSRQHAKFMAEDGALSVTDLGSANGSFIDGEQLVANETVVVAAGQTLKLGQTEYVVEEVEVIETVQSEEVADEPEQSVSTEEPTPLINGEVADAEPVVEGKLLSGWSLTNPAGDVIDLPIGETTMGRSAGKSDIAISGDGYISSLHLQVTATSNTLEAEDLGSTNGTKHNGDKLAPNTPVALADGDSLRVGETEFTVGQAEAIEVTDTPDEGDEQ